MRPNATSKSGCRETYKEIAAQAADSGFEEYRDACAPAGQGVQTHQEGRAGLKLLPKP